MRLRFLPMGTGILSSIGSAFVACGTVCGGGACCVPPVLSLLGLSSYSASYLSFMQPLQPYLISITVFSLGTAFYRSYKKPSSNDACCTTDQSSCCDPAPGQNVNKVAKTLQSRTFLWVVTAFCILMYALPHMITDPVSNDISTIQNGNTFVAGTAEDTVECCSSESSCEKPCE